MGQCELLGGWLTAYICLLVQRWCQESLIPLK